MFLKIIPIITIPFIDMRCGTGRHDYELNYHFKLEMLPELKFVIHYKHQIIILDGIFNCNKDLGGENANIN